MGVGHRFQVGNRVYTPKGTGVIEEIYLVDTEFPTANPDLSKVAKAGMMRIKLDKPYPYKSYTDGDGYVHEMDSNYYYATAQDLKQSAADRMVSALVDLPMRDLIFIADAVSRELHARRIAMGGDTL